MTQWNSFPASPDCLPIIRSGRKCGLERRFFSNLTVDGMIRFDCPVQDSDQQSAWMRTVRRLLCRLRDEKFSRRHSLQNLPILNVGFLSSLQRLGFAKYHVWSSVGLLDVHRRPARLPKCHATG